MRNLLTFEAANSWLKSRVNVPTDMTSAQLAMAPDFGPKVRAHAFFSAQVTQANVLESLREWSNRVAAGEINIATARMQLKTFLAAQGFPADDVGMTGKPPAGVDEKTWKARKSVTNIASTRRLDLILRQNSAMAHAVGRREVSMDPAVRRRWPYFRYLARMDGRERAEHGGYNNLVLPKEHPFWHTHTGPWDFNCRCDVEDADEAEAKQYGVGKVEGQTVYNPGTGQTIQDLPNESGFVFDVEAAFGADPESFDWAAIKNVMLREKVKAAMPLASPAQMSEYERYAADLKAKYGDDLYALAEEDEIEKLEALERAHYAAMDSGGGSGASAAADEVQYLEPERPDLDKTHEKKVWWTGQQVESVEEAAKRKGSLYLTDDPNFAEGYGTPLPLRVKKTAKVLDTGDEKAVERVARRLKQDRAKGLLTPELDRMIDKLSMEELMEEIAPREIRTVSFFYDNGDLQRWLNERGGFDAVSYYDRDTMLLLDAKKVATQL